MYGGICSLIGYFYVGTEREDGFGERVGGREGKGGGGREW